MKGEYKMTDTPIYSALKEHREKDYSSFHTPGHKSSSFLPEELFSLDYTELPDTDSLYEADGVIAQTETKLARLFGVRQSLISAGGCTLAIQTMLALASQRGRKMIFGRNIHRSAVNACGLLDIEPIWLLPHSESGFFTGRISPQEAEHAFLLHPDASALYVTSPDYYGELSDIKALAQICHSHGALLLVDNAHGSHLAFGTENLHPAALGADMSADSLHKTLPVLTGGALLNIACDGFDDARRIMALFGSTSPSYPVMASIDLCRAYMNGSGREEYAALEKRTGELKKLAGERGLVLPQGECDPLRLCVNTSCAGLSGADRQTYHFHRFHVEPEFCDGENAVFIITPFNTERDFSRLSEALSALSGNGRDAPAEAPSLPLRRLSPREAIFAGAEKLSARQAFGETAAEGVCPCPPGVPVVMPGEVIGEAEMAGFEKWGIKELLCVKKC